MKIVVPAKRAVDYNVKIRVKADGSGVELSNVKMSMNPFDEIAIEEALRIKESGKATADFGVDVSPRLKVLKTSEPPTRAAGVKVGSVSELVAKLKDEAGALQ
jgi:electron transfer flavoprotein alpha/beta subunit